MWPRYLLLALLGQCGAPAVKAATDRRGRTCFESSAAHKRAAQGISLKLERRGWLSHHLVTAVAKILLEEELRFSVTVEDASHNQTPNDDYEALARGDFDANFEIWPMGKDEQYDKWVKDGPGEELSAISAGSHSVLQRSGLYIPRYLADRHPETKFYKRFKDISELSDYRFHTEEGSPEGDTADVCRNSSEAWKGCRNFTWYPDYCAQEGCKVQLLKDVTGYDQGVLEQQIRNNGLSISVAYLGFEKKKEVVWHAYAEGKPFLFYHWEPSSGILDVSMDHFSKVAFPPAAGRQCGHNEGRPNGTLRCELGKRNLQRVVSPKLAAARDALRFAELFDLNNADYAALFAMYSVTDASTPDAAEDAACRWLRDVGPDRWKAWVHYTKYVPFDPTSSECWHQVYVQLLFFFILAAVQIFLPYLCRRKFLNRAADEYFDRVRMTRKSLRALVTKNRSSQARVSILVDKKHPDALEEIAADMRERSSSAVNMTTRFLAWLNSPVVQVEMALHLGLMNFMSYRRDIEAFSQHEPDSEGYLADAPSTFRIEINSMMSLLHYLLVSSLSKSLLSSAALGTLAGAFGTLSHLYRQNLRMNAETNPDALPFFESSTAALTETVGDFRFLPVFLIGLFVSYESSRWLQWIDAAFMVQAGLHNVCLAVAGAFQCASDRPEIHRQKVAIQYKFYRYLNVLHYLVYFGLDPRLGNDPVTVCRELHTVGLLDEEERATLARSHPKMRDTMLAWLTALWHQQVQTGIASSDLNTVVMQALMKLRGAAATPLVIPDMRPPTVIKVMLQIVTYVLVFLVLLCYPLSTQVGDTCLQWWAIIQTYLFAICHVGMLSVLNSLAHHPLHPDADCINIDVLLCDTEMMTFHVLRAGQISHAEFCQRGALPKTSTRACGNSTLDTSGSATTTRARVSFHRVLPAHGVTDDIEEIL
eukprot:TRINITY_DN17794_c0_g1_i1.p1 TRINITY_DN17794_c0_g1~~TRINITY_DN17794_c0_g1_i1.p1  ORF type:complete len:931 (-),score=135.05 TRINITY_DN17794_c0_g1_i1:51-2843(-)